jgi:eukaryotic-like serine/threonine-protein kinase
VSAGLEALILKCLDKDPGLRYQSARELLVDLERLQSAATSGEASRPVAVTRPRRRWLWLCGAAAPIAIAMGGWMLRPVPPPRITEMRPVTRGLDAPVALLGAGFWATDGVRLYYLDTATSGQAELFQAPIAGGDPSAIPLPVAYQRRVHDYLPRESALLVSGFDTATITSTDPQFWVVSVPSGTARRIGLRAHCAAVSADGDWLAWIHGGTIWVGRVDGSDARELATLASDPHFPSWSPDGRTIRFDATRPGGEERWIWEISVTGGTPRPLWPGAVGRWTGDGRYFVFERRSPSSSRDDLWAVRESRRLPWARPGPWQLTSGPVSFSAVGSSPDGRRLFARGQADHAELVRYDAAARRFVPHLGGAQVTHVAPSPDGRWLAWVEWPFGGGLWRGRTDGSDRMELTPRGWWAALPRWSWDGTRVVFVGGVTGAAGRLYVVSAGGGGPRLIAEPQFARNPMWDACWLPDDRTVVFSHLGPGGGGLFRADVETGQVSKWPGSDRLTGQKCSRQGAVLAFERPAPGQSTATAWVARDASGAWENLGPLQIMYPNWSSDGRSVLGLQDRPTRRIVRFSLSTQRLDVVVDLSDFRLAPTQGTFWMALAPDGAPLVVRDRSTSDIFALDWEAP